MTDFDQKMLLESRNESNQIYFAAEKVPPTESQEDSDIGRVYLSLLLLALPVRLQRQIYFNVSKHRR